MDDAWLAGIGAGLLGSQTALAVHGLTDAVTWGTRPALVVWVMWGLAIATWMLIRSERTSQTPERGPLARPGHAPGPTPFPARPGCAVGAGVGGEISPCVSVSPRLRVSISPWVGRSP